MKNKTFNSVIFVVITIIVLFLLNFYMLPLTDKLFISESGGSVTVDNYYSLLIKYIIYLVPNTNIK